VKQGRRLVFWIGKGLEVINWVVRFSFLGVWAWKAWRRCEKGRVLFLACLDSCFFLSSLGSNGLDLFVQKLSWLRVLVVLVCVALC